MSSTQVRSLREGSPAAFGTRRDDKVAGGAVRARMVDGAVRLLATRGVEGTSFSEVLAATDSPRGSVAGGMDASKTRPLAVTVISATEGAVALCRAAGFKFLVARPVWR